MLLRKSLHARYFVAPLKREIRLRPAEERLQHPRARPAVRRGGHARLGRRHCPARHQTGLWRGPLPGSGRRARRQTLRRVFTMRGDTMWIISFRRAHAKERQTYEKKPDPFLIDDENPAWTAKATAEARPFGDVFPAQLATLKKRGRPPVETPKVHIGFRLAADVVEGCVPRDAATMRAWRRCCGRRSPRAGCADRPGAAVRRFARVTKPPSVRRGATGVDRARTCRRLVPSPGVRITCTRDQPGPVRSSCHCPAGSRTWSSP